MVPSGPWPPVVRSIVAATFTFAALLAQATTEGKVDVRARWDAARALVAAGQAEAAAAEFEWLWLHALEYEPALVGVRSTAMVSEMKKLAEAHPAAKQRFVALRDQRGKAIDGGKVSRAAVADWISLNEVVADQGATLAWFDKVKAKPEFRTHLAENVTALEPLLLDAKRWADVGKLIVDPMSRPANVHALLVSERERTKELGTPEHRAKVAAERVAFFRGEMATAYACLLAADRDLDASLLAGRARALDAAADLALAMVNKAAEVNEPREEQLEWLDACIAAAAAKDKSAVATRRRSVASALAKAKAKTKRKR